MAEKSDNFVEVSDDHNNQDGGHQDGDHQGPPIVFLRERSLFGDKKVPYQEWIKHEELYYALGESIDVTHISGLQRVNGLWRIYIDNIHDKLTLLHDGVHLRGKDIVLLPTNPYRLDTENTLRVRVQNIPLSADDGIIMRDFTLKGCEVISVYREKLRINGKLTNCETGDRIVNIKKSTVKEPFPRFMLFGKFRAKVIHKDQKPAFVNCNKCFQSGHMSYDCPNEWTCTLCKESGHKQSDCPTHEDDPLETSDTCMSESESESSDDETPQQTEAPKGVENTKKPNKKPNKNKEKVNNTPKEPRAKKQDKQQKQQQKLQQQQTPIDKFMTNSKENRKTRSRSVVRSSPTPAEKINEATKKQKGND